MLDLFETSWRDLWEGAAAPDGLGAVYTRRPIVDLILDLAGYRPSAGRLSRRQVLEPSCGDGAFLGAVIDRLIRSERRLGEIDWSNAELDRAIRAVDISDAAVQGAREMVRTSLREAGCPSRRATHLAQAWSVHGDFLLMDWPSKFDLVVGNPPYVRIEELPRRVLERYRQLFATTSDRADLYVAFIERGLQLLSQSGKLAFITANRFAKNKYGGALRRLIASQYHVSVYLNLEHTQPFEQQVSAYPAILVVDRKKDATTLAATLDDVSAGTLKAIRSEAVGRNVRPRLTSRFSSWYADGGPWVATNKGEYDWVSQVTSRLPKLEEAAEGIRVGIGCATGSDRAFVLDSKRSDIEDDRQLPLVLAGDITNAEIRWSGHYLLNPFADNGELVSLREYRGLAAYLKQHYSVLARRHVARARAAGWYRTIDRIWPDLTRAKKLVIPDIQVAATIGMDRGEFYPHHNVYFVLAPEGMLGVLKGLLRSSCVRRQVEAFSVQMRGGSVRYQAQTLRRLRVPALGCIRREVAKALEDSAWSGDQQAIDEAATEAFSEAVARKAG